jgi:hypothetical protein
MLEIQMFTCPSFWSGVSLLRTAGDAEYGILVTLP